MTDLNPKGLVLVPREVLQAMLDRLEFCLDTFGAIQDHGSEAADIEDWRAYIAASPTPPVEAEAVDMLEAIRRQYETVGVTPELRAAYEAYTKLPLCAALSPVQQDGGKP